MSRRLLLVGVMVTFQQGSIQQLACGTLGCMLYLVMQLLAVPYKALSDDFLASACRCATRGGRSRSSLPTASLVLPPFARSVALYILFFASIYYKYAALTQVDELQAVMSMEQRSDYLPSFLVLSIQLFAACFGVLALVALLFGVLATSETRKEWIRQEKMRLERAELRTALETQVNETKSLTRLRQRCE